MSHMLKETELNVEEKGEQKLVYSVRRMGTAATLLNLSHFEPETVHRVFNEIFLLLRNPEVVRVCLANTQYGGSPCVAMRGIGGQENFVFNDEEHLVSFLGKNENQKADDILQYHPIKNDLWRGVATVWDLEEDYTGSYGEDYQILQNMFHEEGQRT